MSIILNDPNIQEKNTVLINTFIDPMIFMNSLLQYKSILIEGAELLPIDSTYNLRPDKLAYDLWGQDLWYPAILVSNNIGSILQFKPELLGNSCLVPTGASLLKVLTIINNTIEK